MSKMFSGSFLNFLVPFLSEEKERSYNDTIKALVAGVFSVFPCLAGFQGNPEKYQLAEGIIVFG